VTAPNPAAWPRAGDHEQDHQAGERGGAHVDHRQRSSRPGPPSLVTSRCAPPNANSAASAAKTLNALQRAVTVAADPHGRHDQRSEDQRERRHRSPAPPRMTASAAHRSPDSQLRAASRHDGRHDESRTSARRPHGVSACIARRRSLASSAPWHRLARRSARRRRLRSWSASARSPPVDGYHLLRGDLLEKVGRLDQARTEFERAALLERAAAYASQLDATATATDLDDVPHTLWMRTRASCSSRGGFWLGRRPGAQGKTPACWQRSSPGAPLGAPARCWVGRI
jgi:hypothetical protein